MSLMVFLLEGMNDLNPSDIETIDVLKDVSYGYIWFPWR